MTQAIVAKLHKCRNAINAHVGRGRGLGTRGAVNVRGCTLLDRYNDLKAQLTQVGGNSNPAWVVYCDSIGAAPSHNGYDLFC